MEIMLESSTDIYEVEKIINRKILRNKKYYLIKWLCYPINQSTWEPKSNLKHLNYLLEEFEARYPFSVDQEMYNIFCEEVKKKKILKKKKKNVKESENGQKFLAKKKKFEYFSDLELNDEYLDKLKNHLYINTHKKSKEDDKLSKTELIIDLSSTNIQSEESNININENNDISELKMPQIL